MKKIQRKLSNPSSREKRLLVRTSMKIVASFNLAGMSSRPVSNPQNRKYITYCIFVRNGSSYGYIGNTYKKFREVWIWFLATDITPKVYATIDLFSLRKLVP